MTLFGSTELVARVERAEAALVRAGAEGARRRLAEGDVLVVELAGGIAVCAGESSPLNKLAGLGFGGLPDVETLAGVEQACARRAMPVRAEVATLAPPELFALLADRAYRLVGHENVLGLALAERALAPAPEGVEVAPSVPAELAAWLDVIADGFAHPDDVGVPSDEHFPREVLDAVMTDLSRSPGFSRYLARRSGAVAGGASLRIGDGIAQLAGAATAPAHRRRGVQTALLRARLEVARAAGCDLAVVTTQPGSKSQENMQRAGFELLYARAILVRG